MLAVGLALDTAYYRPVPASRAGLRCRSACSSWGWSWAVGLLQVEAPLPGALGFLRRLLASLAQALGHAVFPLARLSYGEDGGELERSGQVAATALVVLARRAASPGRRNRRSSTCPQASIRARSSSTTQHLIGEPGAVVRGGSSSRPTTSRSGT